MERLIFLSYTVRLLTTVVIDSHWYTDIAKNSQMAPFFFLPSQMA